MSPLSRALSVLREDGIRALAEKFARRVSRSLEYSYLRVRKEKSIEMAGSSISIRISDIGAYTEVTFFERNEERELTDLLEEIEAEDVFYDIGANIGIYSLFADEYASDVYAIEPHPTNAHQLLNNSQLNQSDVHIVLSGLSDESGYQGLEGPRDKAEADGKVSLSDNAHDVFVRTDTGDELTTHLPSPDVVKIDVEGVEIQVLDGLSETLATEPPRLVYCEVHENRGVSRKSVTSLLEKAGYETVVFEDYGPRTMLKAKHRTAYSE